MKMLAKTGYHCVILALLGIAPTIFTGYLDWQHRFGGGWEFLIVLKMGAGSRSDITATVDRHQG